MDTRPTLMNGPTIYGRFGRKDIRHPSEMPLLVAVSGISIITLLLYVWGMTLSSDTCSSVSSTLGDLSGFGSADVFCSDTVLNGAEAFLVFINIVIAVAIAVWVLRAYTYAQYRSSGVRMSPTQFPEGYRMVVEAAQRTGLRRVPDAYVVLGNGTVNAFASGHGHRRFIVVFSDMFEVGGAVRDPNALRFVINHEVGHLAAGHTSFFRLILISIGSYIPLLGTALSRAQEYTADNYGYEAAPEGAPGVIGVLGAGKYLGAHVNFHAMADRAASDSDFWVHIANWLSTHPILTWRAQALRDRSRPGRIMLAPRVTEGAVWAKQILPSPVMRTESWPTPQEVLRTLDTVKPVYDEEQFGRFPGLKYDVPLNVFRLANPAPLPEAPTPTPSAPYPTPSAPYAVPSNMNSPQWESAQSESVENAGSPQNSESAQSAGSAESAQSAESTHRPEETGSEDKASE